MNTNLPLAIYATAPSPRLTERYVHINTSQIISALSDEGFSVSSAKARGHRASAANPYGQHVVVLEHPDLPAVQGAKPQFLFRNSHDGSTGAWAALGAFRFACANGLVVGTTLHNERARHAGAAAASLIERIRALAKNTAPMFQQIERWTQIELSAPRAHEFARLASVLRWGDPHRFDAAALLEVRREEDDAGDLWTVFNRVQESTTKHPLSGLARSGRAVMSRPLTAIGRNVKFNAQLWDLAEEFSQ